MSSKKKKPEKAIRQRKGISRREFARRAALASAAVAGLPAAMLHDAVAGSPSPHSGVAAQSSAPTATADAEAQSKTQAILTKYGSRLSEEQKADIRRLVAETQKHVEKLRAYPVDNSDQPATILKPLMERPARPASASAEPSAQTLRPAPKPSQ